MTKALLRLFLLVLIGGITFFTYKTASFPSHNDTNLKFDKEAIIKNPIKSSQKVTDFVFFDISSGQESLGRIVIGLFSEIVPKTSISRLLIL